MKTVRIEELPLCRVRDRESDDWKEGYRHVVTLNRGDYPNIVVRKEGGLDNFAFCELIPEKTKRLMTHAEVIHWACSADALGWVVRCDEWGKDIFIQPQCANYDASYVWLRARMTPNGPEEWQPIEVEE